MKINNHIIQVSFILTSFLGMHHVQAAIFKDKQFVIRDMQTIINQVFKSNDNMLTQKLDFKPLENFLSNLDPYINEKITVKVVGKDKDISAVYTQIKGVAYDLINTLKVLLNAYMFLPNKSKKDLDKMEALQSNFVKYETSLKAAQATLKKIRSKTLLTDKKDAIDILNELAQELGTISIDAATDYYTALI